VGIVAFVGLSLSLGGLTWWLVTQARSARSSPAAEMQEQVTADFSTRDGATIAGEKAVASVIELFNGHDLEGWDFDPDVWSVRNGVIYGHQKRGGYGSSLFWRDANLDDFELRFRFRLVRGNSGIYYRANRLANFDVGGYEFEVYTNRTGNLADNGTDRVKRRLHRAEAAESIDAEWHEGVIIASGSRLVHLLDGKVYCDVEDTDPAAPRTGAMALAMGSSTIVEFKDLRLIRLPRAQ
jgi:hypothetical protein